MPIVTIVVGSLLVSLGIIGYVFSDSHSLTALIPAAFGLLLEICGALAMRPQLKKHAMHGASVIALLGVLGSVMGTVTFVKLIAGADVARPMAAKVQAAMFVTCLVFLGLCVRSFQAARAQRLATAASA